MTSTNVELDRMQVTSEGGQPASVEVLIRNSGDIVSTYKVEVTGTPREWAEIDQAQINLDIDDEAVLTVTFTPPRNAEVASDSYPFAVIVRSLDVEGDVTTTEGMLEVLPFTAPALEFVQPLLSGRFGGKYKLIVSNRGNTPFDAELVAVDPDGVFDTIRVDEPEVRVDPDMAHFVRVDVKPHGRMWTGQPITQAFSVAAFSTDATGESTTETETTANARWVRKPMLPAWWLKGLIALAAILAGLALLWYFLLKPSIESVAQEAATDAVAEEVAAATAAAQQQADTAAEEAKQAKENAAAATDKLEALEQAGLIPGEAPPEETGVSEILRVNVAPGATNDPNSAANSFVVPDTASTKLSDVIFSNPAGDSGTLVLTRQLPGQATEDVWTVALENFRDLDYHFVTPLDLPAGARFGIEVTCTNPAENCTPQVFLAGVQTETTEA